MKKELRIYLLLTILPFAFGCSKFVDVPVPNDRAVADRVFETDAKATSAVTAVYGQMINGGASFVNSMAVVQAGLTSDELLRFNATTNDDEFANNEISPLNTQLATLWRTAYQFVYYANANIEGLNAATGLTPSLKTTLLGESYFVRAFCYSYLTGFFGDVPLVLGTDYRTNALLPRTARSVVMDTIVADLQRAESLLPIAYTGTERIRPNKYTATALLARTWLLRGDWQRAEAAADEVLASGLYTPLPTLQTAFLKGSKEAVWQLVPTSGALRETGVIRPSGTAMVPQYYLRNSTVTAFEPLDGRRQRWIDSVTYLSTRYYFPAKYRNTTTTATEYLIVFRAGELLLLRAEARARQDRLPEAIADINTVRQRAGLAPLLTTIGRSQVLAAIENERRAELFSEWGHRWFDLVRWDRANTVLGPLKTGWQPTDMLYPIPQEELNNNLFLTQNPGY